MYAVAVNVSPGSGWLGVNCTPLSSINGRISGASREIKVSPIMMSRAPSPSKSANAGAAQALCGKSSSSVHPEPIPA